LQFFSTRPRTITWCTPCRIATQESAAALPSIGLLPVKTT
jgi:hypothetical protein